MFPLNSKSHAGFDRISFLTQAAEYVAINGNANEAKLGCYLQYVGREIGLKHQVCTPGWEVVKRKRCKKCFMSLNHPSTATFKVKKSKFTMTCSNCRTSKGKSYPVSNEPKSHYEKLMYGKSEPTEASSKE